MKAKRHIKFDAITALLIALFFCGVWIVYQAVWEQKAEIQAGMDGYQELAEAVAVHDEPQENLAAPNEPALPDNEQPAPAEQPPSGQPADEQMTSEAAEPATPSDAPDTALSGTPDAHEVPAEEADVQQPQTMNQQHTASGVDLAACRKINADFIAWLRIPDTKISYPVVQSDDVERCLTYTFSGEKNKVGTLFSLTTADYETPGRNIAIYGHHITTGGGNMFQPLISYKDRAFFEAHPLIYLDSLYHSAVYRVFAVFNYHDGGWDAGRNGFTDAAAFTEFMAQAEARALYDTGTAWDEDAQALSLITCDREYSKSDGRLVVMAVRVQEEE